MKTILLVFFLISLKFGFSQQIFFNSNDIKLVSILELKADSNICIVYNLFDKYSREDSILITIKIFNPSCIEIPFDKKDSILKITTNINEEFLNIKQKVNKAKGINVETLNSDELFNENFWVDSVIYVIKNKIIFKYKAAILIEYYWISHFEQITPFQCNQLSLNIYSPSLEINFDYLNYKNKKYWTFYKVSDNLKNGKLFLNKKRNRVYEYYRHSYGCRDCDLKQTDAFIFYKPKVGIISFKQHIPIIQNHPIYWESISEKKYYFK